MRVDLERERDKERGCVKNMVKGTVRGGSSKSDTRGSRSIYSFANYRYANHVPSSKLTNSFPGTFP